ncbi:MAG: LytR C-terminal domain-containing protein, partial [Rhodocyclaceae bacterium]|nr:LytR C-terminal domain-containing protein [Rhodocyclaceae bacterium]
EVHYRPDRYAEARALAGLLPRQVALVETEYMRKDIQVRIVLGKDIARDIAYFGGKGEIRLAQRGEKLVSGK